MTKIAVVLVFAASSLLGQTQESSVQARDILNRGVSAFRNADYPAAVNFFKRALQLDPDWTTAELYLATAYAQQFVPGARSPENHVFAENATESFKRVLRHDPNNENALTSLAGLYQNLGELQNAREVYRRVTQVDPQNAVAFYAVGAVDWQLVFDRQNPLPLVDQVRLVDEGLENLDSAIALNPRYDDAMAYKNLLFREKARLAFDPAEKTRLTALADGWFEKALETRKQNAEARRSGAPIDGRLFVGAAPPSPPPPPQR